MSRPFIPPKPSAYDPASPGYQSPRPPSPGHGEARYNGGVDHIGSSGQQHYYSHPPASSAASYLSAGGVTGKIDGLMEELASTMHGMGTSDSRNGALYDVDARHQYRQRDVSPAQHYPSVSMSHDRDNPGQRQYSPAPTLPAVDQSRPHVFADPAASRPQSLSASGIISLYAEDSPSFDSPQPTHDDAFTPDQVHPFRFPGNSPSPALPASPPPVPGAQSRRHVSRPLPVTPQMGANGAGGPGPRSPPLPISPDQASFRTVPAAGRLSNNQGDVGSEYFSLPSQSSSTSQPSTPLGQQHHSTSSSFSSRMYEPSPYRSNASSHGTPSSIQFHRPLPSTSSQASDPRLSPGAHPEHIRRNQSFAHGLPPDARASSASSFALRQPSSSSSFYSQRAGRGIPEAAEVSYSSSTGVNTGDSRRLHSPDNSFDQSQNRYRTQSDAIALQLSATPSRRHPLPPVPPSGHTRIVTDGAYEITETLATSDVVPSRSSSRPSIDKRPFADGSSAKMGTWSGLTPMSPARREQALVRGQDDDVDLSLLSNLAVLLRAAVPRGTQIKGSIDYPQSFTGKDVVTTLQNLIPPQLAAAAGGDPSKPSPAQHRRIALLLAKSLKSQLFFHEVDWGENELRDGVEEVYSFLEDSLAGPAGHPASGLGGDSSEWSGGLGPHKKLDLSLGFPGLNDEEKKRLTATSTSLGLGELPTGVFTALTKCYSPLCGKPGAGFAYTCYSASCPNAEVSRLSRNASTASSGDEATRRVAGAAGGQQGVDQSQKKAWAELVPPDLLKSIPAAEVARQNAILETIQKEEEFLSDLEILDSLFVKGLQKPSPTGDPPPLPIGPERDAFISEVFGNHLELTAHIRQLVERLHVRQREENPIIQTIGDIFLSAALEWGEAYIKYLVNYPLAISRVKRELAVNPRFKAFVETCRRNPIAHKHPLENFLFRPPARLQRYHLHLESILKKTEDGNADRDSLQNAIEIINDQCKTAQSGVEQTETKVKIREYAYNLAAKRNKSVIDMDLLNPERQLIHQGRVLRKPDAFDFDWTELLAVLFDNYFVVTKQKRKDDEEDTAAASRFVLAKRPIPVEMLELSGFADASISRSIGLSNFHIRSERDARDFWPFTVSHLGSKIEPLTLFAPSREARDEWKAKLEEAIGLRTAIQDANKVFEPYTLSDDVFALPSVQSVEPDRPVAGADPGSFHGRVTCAVPFTTQDGRRLVAVGCADGVWIGLRNDSRSLRKVLHLKLVTQCAVLETFGIFVVLADKVLISYSLEALVPSASSNTASLRPPQKLSGNRDVLFFNVGVLKDRTLLVYMKKKANESVFRALEPVLNAPRANEGKSGSGFFGKFGKDSKSSDWFRIYKTFFIPSEAYAMQFLRSKLCIVCARGFEIMNLDSLLPGTIPDFAHASREDPRVLHLQKRVETARPLGMFKTLDGHFLLCYDAFACYVDRLGEPIKLDNIIEWEGYPKDVAFSGRYVLAFDSRFIEVRDTQTGQLVQIIRGADIRHVSGSGSISSSSSSTSSSAVSSPDASLANALDADANPVIFVKRKRAHGRVAFDFQAVYELAPTAPPIALSNNPSFVRSNTIMTASSRSSNAASSNWI